MRTRLATTTGKNRHLLVRRSRQVETFHRTEVRMRTGRFPWWWADGSGRSTMLEERAGGGAGDGGGGC